VRKDEAKEVLVVLRQDFGKESLRMTDLSSTDISRGPGADPEWVVKFTIPDGVTEAQLLEKGYQPLFDR
jgi:hypothetical protein